ncbi:MAG: PBSX family phage terminase large subunit [Oscillospiraceae bacterium]|nr:PBSX family phage terminase large subunit [Oscillospiraceae bacterium]
MLHWWLPEVADSRHHAILCDGAVRSGKTLVMFLSFFSWMFFYFRNTSFALCGRTVAAVRRNMVTPYAPLLRMMGFLFREKSGENLLEVTMGGRTNRVYLFGGNNVDSAGRIQGMTLGGVFFDEVALMPRSFVEQAIARCSPENAKLWFNCNPEYPQHWFHLEWVLKAQARNALYLRFTMEDNPSLSQAVKARYRAMYSGAFYQRYIEGKWCAAEGLVYPMFGPEKHVLTDLPVFFERYAVSCDYGTANPSSFGLWGRRGETWTRLREYYWDARREGRQRTDEEHYRALEQLAEGLPLEFVTCDPSAASFIECIRRHGRYTVLPARNDVLAGIRQVADALLAGRLLFHAGCGDCLREFGLYCWDESAAGRDVPRKENDHAMDDVRYFVATAMQGGGEEEGFFASVGRSQN